jgi:heterodisulfide reductase subunit A-like polyferredoxin
VIRFKTTAERPYGLLMACIQAWDSVYQVVYLAGVFGCVKPVGIQNAAASSTAAALAALAQLGEDEVALA